MISVQEKLNIFRQELDQKLEEERREALKEANTLAAEEINRSDIYILEQRKEIENRYKLLEERNVKRLLGEAKAIRKGDLLKLRRDIDDNFFETVAEELDKSREGKLYQDYLKKSLLEVKKLLKKEKTLVLYTRDDEREKIKSLSESIMPEKKFIFKKLPKDQIGGFFVRDKNERTNYDFSLYNILEEHRSEIDLSLEEALREIYDE